MDVLLSRSALSSALSGAAADAFSTVTLYPLDSIKVLMQADSKLSLKEVLQLTFGEYPLDVYRGITPKIVQGVQQKFQYFYVDVFLRELYKRKTGSKPPVGVELLIGYVSALQGLLTTLPLEVTNTRVITSKKRPAADGSGRMLKPGFVETFLDQLKHEGVGSFYKTIVASAILCINPAIAYTAFEYIKARVLTWRGSGAETLGTLDAFVVGIVSKAIATTLTFPLIRAKVVMSVWKKKQEELAKHRGQKSADLASQQPPGMLETMRLIVRDDGVGGLFVGIEPTLTKSVLYAALMLATKERIYGAVKTMVMGPQPVKVALKK
jgi:adenine nucleotide transporter 17